MGCSNGIQTLRGDSPISATVHLVSAFCSRLTADLGRYFVPGGIGNNTPFFVLLARSLRRPSPCGRIYHFVVLERDWEVAQSDQQVAILFLARALVVVVGWCLRHFGRGQ